MKKLQLQVESLAVETFQTGRAEEGPGTVRAQGDDCTWFASCLCETAYYYCGTGPHTIYSCDYTETRRCFQNTSVQQCGTPPITPAC